MKHRPGAITSTSSATTAHVSTQDAPRPWTIAVSYGLSSRRGLLPARAPLRTVRESFPSYGSSNANLLAAGRSGGDRKATFALLMGYSPDTSHMGCVPEDASAASAAVFCFLPVWRLGPFSRNASPDRRGRIRCITHRHWLLRSSQCCSL